ncbi:hypothetical protein EPA93_39675 [Ktedonosporobacter rubrisoli]|uniref:MBL fold metallo-hydrolase n=1 Tax=Ktedonosporobacter rubrisoli TaxID=2509675 RepID=A0A4P6K120_KTERU|nr:hypothetical protein [Ktedonosporobacter rubrisoli]QBD81769.1 hypothetical protein EPA93_39675 [Ktedonosporobacter rubrisoli]
MMNLAFGLSLMPAYTTPDMDQAKRSVHKIAEMNVDTLCLGHGKPLVRIAAAAIRTFANTLSK